jgi:hypothetical protein
MLMHGVLLVRTDMPVAAASAVNIAVGPAVGAHLQSATGNSLVVSGATAVGTPIAGPLGYIVLAAQTRHIITDLAPSTGYTILVSVVGETHSVSIVQGGGTMSSANGVLVFQVSASDEVMPIRRAPLGPPGGVNSLNPALGALHGPGSRLS